jgi:acetyl-CoA synthetase
MAILHFTSGTTGKPKGAVHVHRAVVAHHATAKLALDLHPDDVFWCTADPGWVTGTSYGIIAPLTHGLTSIVDEAEFDAERWYGILRDQKVTVWYTAPTAVRMLMRVGAEAARRYDLRALRSLGIGKGDRVFVLCPRMFELYVACIGTLKNGSVFSPLFSAFGPEPIAARVERATARCSSRRPRSTRRRSRPSASG